MGAVKKQKPYSQAAAIARIIRVAMAREGISSRKELGELIGASEATMSRRFEKGLDWSLSELRKLDRVLNFSNDEVLALVKYARR